MMQLKHIYEVIKNFETCKTENEIKDLALASISEYGAEFYLAGEMPPPNLPPQTNMNYLIGGHWSDRWSERYFQQDYLRKDPTIEHVRTRNTGLLWRDIHHTEEDGKRIFREAKQFGISDGITIPQLALNGSRIGISFAGERIDTENPFLKVGLTVIGACLVDAHQRVKQTEDTNRTIKLTNRETEVMQWIADGFTSIEVAHKLGLSTPTIEKHYRTALKKLEAFTRAHAVAKALRLGLLK